MQSATGSGQVLTAMQVTRQTLHMEILKKVVFRCEIARRPHQPRRRDFWTSLGAKFHFPPDSVLIADVQLGAGALHVLLNERKCSAGLMVLASRSVKQIERRDIRGITPESRLHAMPEFGYSGLAARVSRRHARDHKCK